MNIKFEFKNGFEYTVYGIIMINIIWVQNKAMIEIQGFYKDEFGDRSSYDHIFIDDIRRMKSD